MTARKHIVITGTGRTGTTFIVRLLTHLGLDTGFPPPGSSCRDVDNQVCLLGRAGLETDIRAPGAPYIIKSIVFVDYMDEILTRDDIEIEQIFVPMRDLYAAAESRRYVHKKGLENNMSLGGGLWKVIESVDEQEGVLLDQVYKLMLSISKTDIPVTLMEYPRILRDSAYLYNKLRSILSDIPFVKFNLAFEKIINPDLIHDFKKNCEKDVADIDGTKFFQQLQPGLILTPSLHMEEKSA